MILWLNKIILLSKKGFRTKKIRVTYIIIFIICIFPNFGFVIILFFRNITILYYLLYYLSWANKLDGFTNIVDPNSQLRHSRHLLVHIHIPKHHQLSNQQQHLSLLLETKIKTIMFCIPKIPSRIMQASEIMTAYSLVRQKGKNYSVSTISKSNHYTKLVAATSSSILNLSTPKILPPVGK